MNSLFKQLSVLLLCLGLSVSAFAQTIELDAVTTKYQPYFKELNTGMGILVKKGDTYSSAQLGNFNIDANSVFNIGSATKKITCILLLQEEEKGHLQLSDSIGMYLAPIANVDGSLTIETLMRHRSGLGEVVGREFEAHYFAAHDSIYSSNFLDKIPAPQADKRGEYDYCNTNYLLLGRILEKVTDQSYFDLVRERIFEVCDMQNSYAYVSKSIKQLIPPTHQSQDVSAYLDYRFFAQYAHAAGSIASSLNDMAKFYEHLFKKNTLLQASSLSKLIAFDDADYGLGLMTYQINEQTYYGHGGNNIGYSFREFYQPETGEMVFMFANAMSLPFYKMIKKDVFASLKGEETELTFSPTVDHFQAYVGTYYFKEMDMNINLIEKNKQLYLEVQGMELLLVSYEENNLNTVEYGIQLGFDPDKTKELTFNQNGMSATLEKVVH